MKSIFSNRFSSKRNPKSSRPSVQPRLENLEAREVLTTYIVGNTLYINQTSGDDIAEVRHVTGVYLRITDNNHRRTVSSRDFDSIRWNGYGGNDYFSNESSIPVYAKGGSGSDRIYGGEGDDTISGGSNNDFLYGKGGHDLIYGDSGNDRLYGYDGNDTLIGGMHDDSIYGHSGDDSLVGSSGDDRLYGYDGDDELHGNSGKDYLFGMDDNDILYGGPRNDWLDGGADNDGLFGGDGTDTVYGRSGADRFLSWRNENGKDPDSLRDVRSEDAIVTFQGSPAVTGLRFQGLQGSYDFAAGQWNDFEIRKIDVALHNLHHHVGNTRLLKKSNRDRVTFVRMGTQLTFPLEPSFGNNPVTINGFNGGGRITMVDSSFTTDDELVETVYHEMGHNWDQRKENAWISDFRELSGWVQSDKQPSSMHVASTGTGDNWWFLSGSDFARGYGMQNPYEDYATTWETYFMIVYHGTTPNNVVGSKFGNLDALFNDLRNS